MRTIIAGSRSITDPRALTEALMDCGWEPTVVLNGTARGADQLGADWARANHIPVEDYPADWERYGEASAGRIRNEKMAANAQALIALYDGRSPGTRHMIQEARARGLKVYVRLVRPTL